MNKTKTLRLGALLCIVSGALAVSCSHDEVAANGGEALPDGMYPLEIGAVTIGVEGSEAQPWGAKTRVTETSATECAWSDGDQISVRIGDDGDAGTYKYEIGSDNVGTFTAVTPCYWQSTQAQDVTAWYTSPTYTSTTDGTTTINLSNQKDGLAYVMKATAKDVAFNNAASLTFTHQLAKVRVKLKNGTSSTEVSTVEIYNYTSCTNTGDNVTAGNQGWITMHDAGDNTWEANIVPTTPNLTGLIRVNGYSEATVSGISEFEAGQMHTLTITLHTAGTTVVDLSQQSSTYKISDSGTYYFTGSNASNGYGISVTGGSPTIYLDNANIAVNGGNAISITGNATATIHVSGTNEMKNTSNNTDGAGVYVASGSSVIIEGDSQSDVLTAKANRDGAGIGSCGKNSCGDITIKNVTVKAYGSSEFNVEPGIGGYNDCGKITIDNAIVYAQTYSHLAPTIGCQSKNWTVNIEISGSEIDAYRYVGSSSYKVSADYIGLGYSNSSSIQGIIKNSTVNKYTYYRSEGETSNDGTVTYDENGDATTTTE